MATSSRILDRSPEAQLPVNNLEAMKRLMNDEARRELSDENTDESRVSGNQQTGSDNVQQNIGTVLNSTIIGRIDNIEKLELYITSEQEQETIHHSGGTSAIIAKNLDDLIQRPQKLIGRDKQMQELLGLIAAGKRVLLLGFAGTGKTALAATTAGEWTEKGKGNVIWLKAGNANADALFEALARPFGAQHTIASQDGDSKILAVRQLLRSSGSTLLVLDDCWNGQALYTVMKSIPTGMPLIATARQRYAIDNLVEVRELQPEDALALLLYHSSGRATEDASVLCTALAYNAFAVEIAGKTLKVRRWTPTQLLKEIKDAPHELKTPSDFNEKERGSVKELLDASVNILADEERGAFLAFGAFFAPQLTAEMISNYLGKPVGSQLLRLQDYGLADRIPSADDSSEHYKIHDLAYSYVRAQASDTNREYALEACRKYLLQNKRYERSNVETFRDLRAELNNLLGAASWALETGKNRIVGAYAVFLYTANHFLDYQGFYEEAVKLLTQAAQAAEKEGDFDSQSLFLGNVGNVYTDVGKYQTAIEYHYQALAIAQKIQSQTLQSMHLGNIGNIYLDWGHFREAIKFFEDALVFAEKATKEYVGINLNSIGIAYSNLGDFTRAIEYHLKALKMAQSQRDLSAKGGSLGAIGNTYIRTGEFEKACRYLQKAIKIDARLANRRSEGKNLGNLGAAYDQLDEFDLAIDTLRRAIIISHEVHDSAAEANALGNLGGVYHKIGDYENALKCHLEALAISREIGAELSEGQDLINIGVTYARLMNYQESVSYLQLARRIFERINLPDMITLVDQNLAVARAKLAQSLNKRGRN